MAQHQSEFRAKLAELAAQPTQKRSSYPEIGVGSFWEVDLLA